MSTLRNEYDVIVCGAGSAGCVVAARLATTGARVLLIEAGTGSTGPEVDRAALWPTNIGSERDWQFETEPEPALDDRRIALSMGRGIGGGSSINALVWARGHRRDWDDLAAAAHDDGWSYESALSHYRSIEDYVGGDDRHHGRGGLIAVDRSPSTSPNRLGEAFLAAAGADGIPLFAEQNGTLQESTSGASPTDLAERDGRRSSVAEAYLPAAIRSGGLDVASEATVARVRVEGGRATGVEIDRGSGPEFIAAASEVIVSAGAVQTPALLQRSGIGDRRLLADAGIECIAHVPGVGRNLQDHPLVSSVWKTSALAPVSPSAQALAFLTCGRATDAPDVYLLATEVPGAAEGAVTWSVGAALLAPSSRGTVAVHDSDPFRAPSIRLGYLTEPDDMGALREGLKAAQRLGSSAEMAAFAENRVAGPEGTRDADLDRYLRGTVRSGWHFSGTCRIGDDDLAVVDGELRVRGVEGLRIADTSVLPRVFRGNTMAPAIVIGERAAQIIDRAHHDENGER